jgi:hypothetical protein
MDRHNKQLGASTVEILIAFAILVISLSAVILVAFTNQTATIDVQTNQEAVNKANAELETARRLARTNYNSLGSSGPTVDGIYTKTLTVSEVTQCIKNVTSLITWELEGRPLYVEISSMISDPNTAYGLGGECQAAGFTTRWKNPNSLASQDLVPSGNQGTGIDLVIRSEGRIAFLSSEHSDPSSEDFWVFDVTDGRNPSLVSKLDTGKGLNAVDASGNYAYVANRSNSNQFQVIDVTDLSAPVLVKSISLPGNSQMGQTIYYFGNRVYIGTDRSPSGPELFIYSVVDPTNPTFLGSLEVNADVNKIMTSNSKVYLATSRDNAELMIADVSNPGSIPNPTSAGTIFDAAGSQDATTLYLIGSVLYLGRQNGSEPELYVLNISNPSSVQILGSKTLGMNPNSEILTIIASGPLVFLGTNDSNQEFQVWDISNPADIQFWSGYNFPQQIKGLDYDPELIFAAVNSNDALHVIFDDAP